MFSFFLFLAGLALLLLGSRGVISNAIRISTLTKIPPFVIGVTIVGIGTSLPEMVVSFFGGLENAPGLALGNIIGSNIANIGLILGISLLIRPLYIGQTKTQKNMFVMLLVSLFLSLTLLFDGLTLVHGIVFLILGCGIIFWQIVQGRNAGFIEVQNRQHPTHPALTVILLIASFACLLVGGKLLVDGGIALAQHFHVLPVIIGAVAVALGTSLPELAVSITALTKKTTRSEEKLVIGNILGSNIFNVLFGAGMLGLFGVKHFTSPLSLYAFLFFTLLLSIMLYLFRGKSIPRVFGGGFILFYALYLILLFRGV